MVHPQPINPDNNNGATKAKIASRDQVILRTTVPRIAVPRHITRRHLLVPKLITLLNRRRHRLKLMLVLLNIIPLHRLNQLLMLLLHRHRKHPRQFHWIRNPNQRRIHKVKDNLRIRITCRNPLRRITLKYQMIGMRVSEI